VHFYFDFPRQFAAQILDVNAGTAVDMRRVLPGEQSNSQIASRKQRVAPPKGNALPNSAYLVAKSDTSLREAVHELLDRTEKTGNLDSIASPLGIRPVARPLV
jgi:hypothetical protein